MLRTCLTHCAGCSEGWDPGKTPETYPDLDTFLARLADGAQLPGPTDAAWGAQAATEVLRERLTGRKFEEVLQIPPALVRTLLQPAERA